ncbi:MAG: hypothetical protein ACR2L4_08960 [Actinomycetota bacterium]|nr:hypothetical protein [Actinomycetota bacterium]
MVGTIGFAGSKARVAGRFGWWWRVIGTPHLAAAALGGALLGAVASTVGLALPGGSPERVWVGLALLAIAGGLDLIGARANLIARAKQVPLSWKHVFPAPMSSTLYGATLGIGLASTVYFWSFWAVIVALIVAASPALGLLLGAGYGIGRALPVFAVAGALEESEIETTLDSWRDRDQLVKTLSLMATALLALGVWQLV